MIWNFFKVKNGGATETHHMGVKKGLTDHEVLGRLNEFDDLIRLNEREFPFPEEIRRVDAYIFRFIMRPAYNRIIAKHRKDEALVFQTRTDIIEYIEILERTGQLNSWCAGGFHDNMKTKNWELEKDQNQERSVVIEEEFCSLAGKEFQKLLREIRSMELSWWETDGTEIPHKLSPIGDLAPEGYAYLGVKRNQLRQCVR